MPDFVDVVRNVGYALDIGFWVIELDTRVVYWPKGLGRPETEAGDRGYAASPLDQVLAMVDEADLGRFRGYLADVVTADGAIRVIEVGVSATWGGHLDVRFAGRKVGSGRESRVVGLVQVVDRRKAAERLARSLGFVIEALFISVDGGVVIFDSDLKVRRLNRNALDLFGVAEADESDGSYSAAVESQIPPKVRDLLREALASSSSVSGTLTLGGLGGPRLFWRANPWGTGEGDASGIVMVVGSLRRQRIADLAEIDLRSSAPDRASAFAAVPTLPPTPPPPPGDTPADRHRALEWVRHPIVLVSIRTGEIAFANRIARELFHLPAASRWFVENVYDISGFTCDPDGLAIAAAGGHLLRLPFGARVGRMFGYDDDLLFVEYHADMLQPRVVAPAVHLAQR